MNLLQSSTAPELHLISPGGIAADEMLTISIAVLPYVDYIHLRDKQLSAKVQLEMVQRMHQAGVPLQRIVINDRLDVALAAGAGGIQLAGHSLPPSSVRSLAQGMRVGCSVHSLEEAASAAGDGADYCLFGHVYDSSSKPGIPGRSLEKLTEVARACPVPVIAIGGIRPENAGDIIRHGAQGVAVLSGLFSAPEPAAQAKAYRAAIQTAWLERR